MKPEALLKAKRMDILNEMIQLYDQYNKTCFLRVFKRDYIYKKYLQRKHRYMNLHLPK